MCNSIALPAFLTDCTQSGLLSKFNKFSPILINISILNFPMILKKTKKTPFYLVLQKFIRKKLAYIKKMF